MPLTHSVYAIFDRHQNTNGRKYYILIIAMLAKTHALWLTLAVLLAYIWSSTPFLAQYTLQAVAVSTIFYFLYKKISTPHSWNFTPQKASLELIFITFALLALLGGTGNLDSVFYPITYIHLFLLVFFSETITAIIIACEILLFHYALTPLITTTQISHLVIIPIVLVFFLFAKDKYTQTKKEKLIIEEEEKEIESIQEELQEITQERDSLLEKMHTEEISE